ncbi:MAG: hypothetical protein AAB417_04000, partial [Patescibacteria group bacterium]
SRNKARVAEAVRGFSPSKDYHEESWGLAQARYTYEVGFTLSVKKAISRGGFKSRLGCLPRG